MSEERKMIGKGPYKHDYRYQKYCDTVNEEVIPLLQHYGIPLDETTIKEAAQNRGHVLARITDETLAGDEYKAQPELVREAVAGIIKDRFNEALARFGHTSTTLAAEWCKYDPDTQKMVGDWAKIEKAREIWITGETAIQMWDDYVAAAEALNKLFKNRPIPFNRLGYLFDSHGDAAAPNMEQAPYFNELRGYRGEPKV